MKIKNPKQDLSELEEQIRDAVNVIEINSEFVCEECECEYYADNFDKAYENVKQLITQALQTQKDELLGMIEPHKFKSRIEVLKRRSKWLESQISVASDRSDLSYSKQEISALNWAIKNLENTYQTINNKRSE